MLRLRPGGGHVLDSAIVNTSGEAGLRRLATPRMAWLLLALMCAACWLVFMRTPFVVDLPLMHFVAWRVSEGDAPYVDVWDMNGPVAYMAHQLMMAIPLPTGATVAILMTVMTGACAAAVATIAGRGRRTWLGFAAGVAMLAWVAARGNEYLMQRDMMIAACAVGALALLSAPGARGWRWAAAGALIGVAVGVKPTAAPFALIALAGAVWIDLGEGRRFGRTLWLAAGGAAGGAVWIAWLVATGGLVGFWYVMTSYNSAYMAIARRPLDVLLREPTVSIAIAAVLGCVVATTSRLRAGRADRETLTFLAMAGGFAASAALMFVLQGKGWLYQTAPTAILSVAAGGAALASLSDEILRRRLTRWAIAGGVAISCVAAIGGVREQVSPEFARRQADRVDIAAQMTASLEMLPPGMKVQPLDTTDGALHAMTLAKRAPASPVIYDFWLFLGAEDAIANSRAAVLDAMRSDDPPAILMTNQGWPVESTGFARMREFKEFQSMLDGRYTLTAEGRRGPYGYRLYAPAE